MIFALHVRIRAAGRDANTVPVIAAWEHDLDVPLAKQVLAGRIAVDLTTDTEEVVAAPAE